MLSVQHLRTFTFVWVYFITFDFCHFSFLDILKLYYSNLHKCIKIITLYIDWKSFFTQTATEQIVELHYTHKKETNAM